MMNFILNMKLKTFGIIAIVLASAAVLGCIESQSGAPANVNPASTVTQTHSLKYQLNANNSYVVSMPITINFTLENLQAEKLWILKWYTPLEGLRGEIFLVKCDGKEISYEGMMAKRGDPDRDSYMHIVPRGSVSEVVDLSGAYNIPVSNECQIEFKGRIYDVLSSEDKLPRRRDDHQGMDITGNVVTFRVSGH